MVVLATVVVVVGATAFAVVRINSPLPVPHLQVQLADSQAIPGSPPALPWPSRGQGAVSVPLLGVAEQSGPEPSVPIASLTKMTTAVVVLSDHPLVVGQPGPAITITTDDVAHYDADLKADESTLPIRVGETLTEQQMLEGLLTQSANDLAYSLAVWDAGSEAAFVTKMNTLARSVGATSSHYVDASGYEPATVSTASDCLRIAAAGMAIPAFKAIVGMATIAFPGMGTLRNIVTEVGVDGIIGVKSGYTSVAGGCMVLASEPVVGGHKVLVLSAVLGQQVPPPIPLAPPKPTRRARSSGPTTTTTTVPLNDRPIANPLQYAGPASLRLLQATAKSLVAVTPVASAQPLVAVTTSWGQERDQVSALATHAVVLAGWPGGRVATNTRLVDVKPGAKAGTLVGRVRVVFGRQLVGVEGRLDQQVPEPSWWWRLVHG